MNCPKCNQPVEADAAFCGNCGQSLRPTTPQQLPLAPNALPAASAPAPVKPGPTPLSANQPGYAFAKPSQHTGETKALLALLFGIAGLVGALFLALAGLVLGIAGIVMGTMSRSSTKKGLSTAGLIVSGLAILASLAVWVYAVDHDPKLQKHISSTLPTGASQTASNLSTPCYATDFIDKLTVSHATGSCDASAFNASTLNASTNAYKIYASKSRLTDAQNFAAVASQALKKDVADNLPGFTISSNKTAEFAGSPAYVVSAADEAKHIDVIEAAVLHPVDDGENVFILVHAVNGGTADLDTLEAQWQWK